jgi:lipopolysaccharide heptosyltransferase II
VQSREALDRCPYINECVVCDLDGRDRGFKGLLRLGRELRKKYFDIVIDLQNNRRSHMLAFLTLALSRYGYKKGRFSFLLNRRVDDDAPYLDPVEHQFRTLSLAGIKAASKELELWPSEADAKRADELLEEGWVKDRQGLVGINIRASSRWLTKNWPASHIAELCDRLAREFNIRVVLTGAKGDLEHAVEIARLTKSKPVIAAGKTDVMELAALIKRFRVYLTPDSAPMHIAAAVKTPFVALFGPTDPARHLGPAKDHVVLMKDLKCAPCYSPYCTKGFRCMRTITVDEVLAAMRPYLVSGAAAEEAARQEKRMAA